jgi:hypothetical protein
MVPELTRNRRWGIILELPLPVSRLKYRIAFRRFSRHTRLHLRFLRCYPKIPRRLKRTPDIGILRAAIENNQLHAMRALHLITVAEALRPLAERLVALGTQDFYSVGHEIFSRFLISEGYANPSFLAPDDMAILTFIAAGDGQRDFVRNANRTRRVERCSDPGYVANSAIDAASVELNRSGLEDSPSWCCAPLDHPADLG